MSKACFPLLDLCSISITWLYTIPIGQYVYIGMWHVCDKDTQYMMAQNAEVPGCGTYMYLCQRSPSTSLISGHHTTLGWGTHASRDLPHAIHHGAWDWENLSKTAPPPAFFPASSTAMHPAKQGLSRDNLISPPVAQPSSTLELASCVLATLPLTLTLCRNLTLPVHITSRSVCTGHLGHVSFAIFTNVSLQCHQAFRTKILFSQQNWVIEFYWCRKEGCPSEYLLWMSVCRVYNAVVLIYTWTQWHISAGNRICKFIIYMLCHTVGHLWFIFLYVIGPDDSVICPAVSLYNCI